MSTNKKHSPTAPPIMINPPLKKTCLMTLKYLERKREGGRRREKRTPRESKRKRRQNNKNLYNPLVRARKCLFNDTLNTFYLASDIWWRTTQWKKPHNMDYYFWEQHGFFYMHHLTDRKTHTMAFDTQVVEHWLDQEIAQWVHNKGSIWQPIAS